MAQSSFQPHEHPGGDSTRRALLRLQRGVQRRMQAEVRAFTGGDPPAIERYYREYAREFRRYQSVSSYGELHQELLESDLVFVGDYHTLRQSQEVALRLVSEGRLRGSSPAQGRLCRGGRSSPPGAPGGNDPVFFWRANK